MKLSNPLHHTLKAGEVYYLIDDQGFELPYPEVVKEMRRKVKPEDAQDQHPGDRFFMSIVCYPQSKVKADGS